MTVSHRKTTCFTLYALKGGRWVPVAPASTTTVTSHPSSHSSKGSQRGRGPSKGKAIHDAVLDWSGFTASFDPLGRAGGDSRVPTW